MFDPAAHRENSASLANKTVLITGATSGIGQATALAFARRGANVAIIGRDTGRGRRAIAACEGALPTVPERRRPAGSGPAAAVPTLSVYHSLSIVPVGALTPPGGHGPPASGLPAP